MSTANLDAADLAAALAAPGLIREDVVDTVYNLDEGIPTPLYDLTAGGSFTNLYSEWTEDDLNDPDTDNAVVDGSDASGNDTKIGLRIGNRAQLSDKVVRISHASEEVDSIGSVGRIAYQTSKRLMDLRRDIEAIACGRQASVADDGNTTPGRTAGLGAWIATNASFGIGGSAGGFNTGTKIVDAPVEGTVRGLVWQDVRNQLLGIYEAGGAANNMIYAMSTPRVIRNIVSFLFSDDGAPFRATPTANVTATEAQNQVAQGWIDVVLSDFGIKMRLIPNRLQQTYNLGTATDLFLIDPAYFQISTLYGFRSDVLAKTGHAENRLLSNHWMTKCFREDAHAMIADLDDTAAVTATGA
jgi:hypothetical protein